VALRTDGSFTYIPATGYAGTDTFTYQATNSSGTSAAATVTITVSATTPTATADAYTATAGTPLTVNAPGVLANDTGVPAPTAVKATDPAHGTLMLNADGSFTYTAAINYAGSDSFTYTATNSGGTSAPATVTLNVAAAPLASIAVTPANGSLTMGQARQFTATGTYRDGGTADITDQVTWTSTNGHIASIDAAGNVTGVSPGSTHVTATKGNVSGQTGVTVTATTSAGATSAPPSGRPSDGSTSPGELVTPVPPGRQP
jgi:VCBS repeat-containing protein